MKEILKTIFWLGVVVMIFTGIFGAFGRNIQEAVILVFICWIIYNMLIEHGKGRE